MANLYVFEGPRTAGRFEIDDSPSDDLSTLTWETWSRPSAAATVRSPLPTITSPVPMLPAVVRAASTPLSGTAHGTVKEVSRAALDESCVSSLPRGPERGGSHCYCSVPAETFQVRGPRYNADKVKVSSAPSAFELMHVELFRSHSRIGNVAARSQGWLRKARAAGDRRFYLVISYVCPSAPFVHTVFYYAADEQRIEASPQLQRLWQRFTARGPGADAFRNERWKVIPRVPEGSWIVQRAVGSKPALLATKLTHTWILCDRVPIAAATSDLSTLHESLVPASPISADPLGPYLESDCDVASSSVAQAIVGVIMQYAKLVVIDLAFAIEAREADELPEGILGTVRLSHLDVTKMPVIAALPGDEVLGKPGVFHGLGEDSALAVT
jgi:hypothetical protein